MRSGTVHIDGAATRSCVLPLSAVGPDAKVVTIQGLRPAARTPCKEPGPHSTCRNAATASREC